MELEQLTEGPIGVGTVIRRRHIHYIRIEIPGSTNPINPALLEPTLRNLKAPIESEVPKAS